MSETVIPTSEIGGNFWSLEVSSKKRCLNETWGIGSVVKISPTLAVDRRRWPQWVRNFRESYCSVHESQASDIEEVKQRLVEIWQRSNAAFLQRAQCSHCKRCISYSNSVCPSVRHTPVSRVCAVAQYAVLEASGKVNGIGEISHPSPPNPWTNLDAASNISLRPPRESMCKIWLNSIQPLPLCACVK